MGPNTVNTFTAMLTDHDIARLAGAELGYNITDEWLCKVWRDKDGFTWALARRKEFLPVPGEDP